MPPQRYAAAAPALDDSMHSIRYPGAKEMPPQRYAAAAPALDDVLLPLSSGSHATELSAIMKMFAILSHVAIEHLKCSQCD